MSGLTIPAYEHTGRVTQLRVVRSEWTKLWSVRSTRWSLLVAVLLAVGLAVLVCFVTRSHWSHMGLGEHLTFNPLNRSMVGVAVAQLAIGVLGVLVITAEYSTGMIRATFTAVPRRLPVLWAKCLVFGAVTLALMLPSALVAFFAGQAILRGNPAIPTVTFSDPGVGRAVIGAGLYLAGVGLFALGIGAMIRNTAGGIAAFVAIMFVVPPLMNVLPQSWNDAISPYLPSNAGAQVMSTVQGAHDLSPWAGFAVFCGWIAAAIATAAILLVRRDT